MLFFNIVKIFFAKNHNFETIRKYMRHDVTNKIAGILEYRTAFRGKKNKYYFYGLEMSILCNKRMKAHHIRE